MFEIESENTGEKVFHILGSRECYKSIDQISVQVLKSLKVL